MDRDVLTPEFLSSLAPKTLLWKVNTDTPEGKALRETYKVRGLPTVLLLDAGGKEIDRILGYEGREAFVGNYLAYLYGVGTLPDLLARAGDAPDPETSLAITEKYAGRGDTPNTLAWVAKTRAAKGKKPEGLDYALARIEGAALLPGEPEKGIALLQKLVGDPKAGGEGDEAFSLLGRYYKKKKMDAELVALYDQARAVKGDSPSFLNDYAWTFAERGIALEKALAAAQKAVELSGSDPGIVDTLAEVYHKMGKKEQAVATIEKAIAAKPDDEYFRDQKKKFLGEGAEKK